MQADHAHATGLNFDNSRWTFDGNVRIDAEQRGNLRSDQAVVEFKDNRIARATVTGKPAEFEQKRADSDQLARGHADEIVYDVSDGTVRLIDDAWLTDGQTECPARCWSTTSAAQSVQAGAATRHRPARAHHHPDGCGPEPRQGRARRSPTAGPTPKPETPQ